jgi:uncharacterized protein (TIGR02147 family)
MTTANENKTAQLPEARDMRSFLQQELLRRCRRNPGYSLRAFATQLRVEPSALSKILAGKRGISPRMFDHFVQKLSLAPAEADRLRARIKRKHATASASTSDYQQLTLDMFQVVSDWYHYAILELTHVESFESDPKWVAQTLGITVSEVNIAVERLTRLELMRIDETGRWIDEAGATTNIQNDFTAIALRRLQAQILEMGSLALEETPVDERDNTSMTMAINSRLMPEAKQRIKKFRRELCDFLKSEGPYDRVYQLGVALYPVSKSKVKGK